MPINDKSDIIESGLISVNMSSVTIEIKNVLKLFGFVPSRKDFLNENSNKSAQR